MAAFLIVHSTVTDPEKFQAYATAVGPVLAAFGGEVALRGKRAGVLTGEHAHQTAAVIKFPDQASIVAWYGSPEYQALIANRDAAADVVFISYDVPEG